MTVPYDLARALPRRSTGPWERAIAGAMSDHLPVPVRECLDPGQAPAHFLPFLAVHDGVRIWFSDWADARKRLVISEAPELAGRIGTRSASARMLGYVDAVLVDAVAYPAPFVLGRAVLGRTPLAHPAFVARYLVRIETMTPPRALVLGRGALGRRRLKAPDREPWRRCLVALRAAKAPETEYRVDFGHRRPLSIADAPALDGTWRLDSYVTRSRL